MMEGRTVRKDLWQVGPRRAVAGVLIGVAALWALAANGRFADAQPGRTGLEQLLASPYAPVVKVVDTESSLGPLAAKPETITLSDLVRFHGHPCDGLVAASSAIAYGLRELFPNGVVDRTDVVAAVKPSPCFGDAAEYLTGARARYGSLITDQALGDRWILFRRSTARTIAISLREGIKPRELPDLEAKLRTAGCDFALIRKVQEVQAAYSASVLARPAAEIFTVERLSSFPYKYGDIRPDATKAGCKPPAASGRR